MKTDDTDKIHLCEWGYAKGTPDIKPPMHRHDFYQIEFCESGPFMLRLEGRKIEIGEGDIVIISPSVKHTVSYVADNWHFTFKFYGGFTRLDPVVHIMSNTFSKGIVCAARGILDAMFPSQHFGREKGIHLCEGDTYQTLIEHFIYGVIETVNNNQERFSGVLSRVYELFEISRNKFISVEYAAEKCGYTREHFSRIVKKTAGMSARDFLDEQRMKHAERYLLFSSLSIGEISEILGFSSQFHFSVFFKRKKQMSPMQFRKVTYANKKAT